MSFNWRVRAYKHWDPERVYVKIFRYIGEGKRELSLHMENGARKIKTLNQNEFLDLTNYLSFSDEEARQLYMELANIYGPIDKGALNEELDAVRDHLRDMRRLIFDNQLSKTYQRFPNDDIND